MRNSQLTMSSNSKITKYTKFEIIPNLYLSSFPREIPEEITHVLNMCLDAHPPDTTRTYLHVPLDDIDDITPHIPDILSFINRALSPNFTSGGKNKVLVHCMLGLNRSAAAVVAYISGIRGMSAEDALWEVREKKADVSPCALFMVQIDRFFGRDEGNEDGRLRVLHERLQERKRRGILGEVIE